MKFANCCHPIYGDEIVGFISAGRGIIIHRKVCPNISYFRESRLIEAFWKPIQETTKKTKKKTDYNVSFFLALCQNWMFLKDN